jgi:hypothetical protein
MPPALAFGLGTYPLSEAATGIPNGCVFVRPWRLGRVCAPRIDRAPSRSALVQSGAGIRGALNAYYGLAALLFAGLAADWAGAKKPRSSPRGGGRAKRAAGLALCPSP